MIIDTSALLLLLLLLLLLYYYIINKHEVEAIQSYDTIG